MFAGTIHSCLTVRNEGHFIFFTDELEQGAFSIVDQSHFAANLVTSPDSFGQTTGRGSFKQRGRRENFLGFGKGSRFFFPVKLSHETIYFYSGDFPALCRSPQKRKKLRL